MKKNLKLLLRNKEVQQKLDIVKEDEKNKNKKEEDDKRKLWVF